ncbi:MAG: ATPase superfamily-like protein [Acidobacteria bacterium]|nr:ATPase superfamily-like protein [Acidobacteriota bacterium]
MDLIRRNLLNAIISRLEHERVIIISGARQTGKTTLCESQIPRHLDLAYTYISFDDPDDRLRFQSSAVSILESIETPLIILDEVQKSPSLFDPLKLVVDREKAGSPRKIYLITGSSQLLLLKGIKETLAGRVALFHLYPFSLQEVSGQDKVPLLTRIWQHQRFQQTGIRKPSLLSAQELRDILKLRDEHLSWGGYPPVWLRKEPEAKFNWLKDYRKTYLERDISEVGQVADIDTFALAQKILCSRIANILSISEVSRDLGVAVNTVKRYIDLLGMTFQCFRLPPYFENIGKRFIKSPKLFFSDLGLIKAVLGDLGVSPGALYENWVFTELLKWKALQPAEPELYFYRTSGGLEIDFLIAGRDYILPIEVKAHEKVSAADGRGLESFLREHPRVSTLGLVVYKGRDIMEIRKNIWAVPDWYLLT